MIKTLSHLALATSVFAVLPSGSHADMGLHRKAGLWQTTTTMEGVPVGPQSSKFCIDTATEQAMTNMGQRMSHCTSSGMHGLGNTWTMDAVCTTNRMTSKVHTVTTFNGSDSYHSEVQTSMSPAPPGMRGAMTTIMDAKWLGPCPSDMRPGDVVMSNGMKMHYDPKAMGPH